MGCLLDVHADDARVLARMAEDIRRGLTASPRQLPPKYFYDETGSALFERITELPEYYLTRAEDAILRDIAEDLARQLGPSDIVELGAGACRAWTSSRTGECSRRPTMTPPASPASSIATSSAS